MSKKIDQTAKPVAWQIKYNSLDGSKKTVLMGHNAIADYRLFDANAVSTPLYAAPQPQQIAAGPSLWCKYVAEMVGAYIGEPVESERIAAIAGIIERRLWALPDAKPHQIAEPESQVKQKTTGQWESARVADYNRGWNDCLFETSIERAAVNHKEPS